MSAAIQSSLFASGLQKIPITITPAAALKSWKLIQEAEDPHLKLRVSIFGGGCHGFRYKFCFTDTVDADDVIITQPVPTMPGSKSLHTVDWVIGMISLPFLKGVEIDYESTLGEEQFILRNLKVKTKCSCGHSFAVPEADESTDL
jgi:iron-sulfur cluster assembly accessory protein